MSDYSVSVSISSPEFAVSVELQNQVTTMKKIALVSGNIDGINKVFVWERAPLQVFWQNGKLVKDAASNGYTLAVNTTTLTDAPLTGESLEAYGN